MDPGLQMKDLPQTRRDGNVAIPPKIGDTWDREPQSRAHLVHDEHAQLWLLLWAGYQKKLLLTLRDTLGKRTLSSDQGVLDRVARIANAFRELRDVCVRLDGIERR